MRKKGPIWEDRYQRLIVDSYKSGKAMSEIMEIPEISILNVSTYTVRNVLKANKLKPNWKKQKREPEFWRPEVVDRIISLRNDGVSARSMPARLVEYFPQLTISKSTISRILIEHKDRIKIKPARRPESLSPEIKNKIVEMYQSGMLITDIRNSRLFKNVKPSENLLREVIKSQGVSMTWKKGVLRRWPTKIRKRIVKMFKSGMKYKDIINHPALAEYNPTHYAIRKILEISGVNVKEEMLYKKPISDERFHLYRTGRLGPGEEAIIHKHLAVDQTGREKMAKRMRLKAANELPMGEGYDHEIELLKHIAGRFSEFFNWGMQNLKDESVKRSIIMLGLEFGESLATLLKEFRKNDSPNLDSAWESTEQVLAEMADLYTAAVGEAAN